jgi:hypothetical protein
MSSARLPRAEREARMKSDVLAKLRRASASLEAAGDRRDDLIVEAAEAHFSYSEIAAACGLSKSRVAQIVRSSGALTS